MTFDHTKIRSLNINLGDKLFWNAKTHNMILSYDPKQPNGIAIRAVHVYEDPVPIVDLDQAQHIIKKFTLK
jgi:hypothetical protein